MKDDLVKAVPHQLRSILIQNTTWQRHFLMKDDLVKAVPHQMSFILIQNTTWQRHFLMKDELVKAVRQFLNSKRNLVKAFPYERRPGNGSSSSNELDFDAKHNLAKAFPYERRPGKCSSSNGLYFYLSKCD